MVVGWFVDCWGDIGGIILCVEGVGDVLVDVVWLWFEFWVDIDGEVCKRVISYVVFWVFIGVVEVSDGIEDGVGGEFVCVVGFVLVGEGVRVVVFFEEEGEDVDVVLVIWEELVCGVDL